MDGSVRDSSRGRATSGRHGVGEVERTGGSARTRGEVVERSVDVLVVGAGPAGLGAATRLARAGAGRIEVLERERQPGGIPRHCFHGGFDGRHGPAYARGMADDAVSAGAALRTGVTVTGWAGPTTLETTGPRGIERVTARAVLLATGARERPRAARLIPGTRPAGVLTTGELQQAVHLYGRRIGTRAVVVGAGPLAHHAVLTLRAGGAETVALVTDRPPPPLPGALRRTVPVLHRTTVTALTGHGRLTGVRVRHRDGRATTLACDTVVLTGDWIPDHELARRGGVTLDPATRGPAVDTGCRTTVPGVLAAGNLLRGGERAVLAAAEGRAAAVQVLGHLAGEPWPGPGLPVEAAHPLLWVSPNRVHPDGPAPPHNRFLLRAAEALAPPRLTVRQDGLLLHRQLLPRPVLPGRPLPLSARWTRNADPDGGPVRITL
ncbi:FAD-dependent oxidoreductase [Streptomyces sp. NPDC001985]|uniref:NAD(P)/FAD-dependent oxidoreductase n=1 Tax=Streptomyces sp. NPDC001985 TaxID=3154406 RepID=UPI00331C9D27